MSKEKKPDWINMNLSELVEKSLKLGVVPLFHFLDKDTVNVATYEPRVSPMDHTPIMVLEEEVKFYNKMIEKISTRDGIDKDAAEEPLNNIIQKLKDKIAEFQSAILLLNIDKEAK